MQDYLCAEANRVAKGYTFSGFGLGEKESWNFSFFLVQIYISLHDIPSSYILHSIRSWRGQIHVFALIESIESIATPYE